MSILIRNATLVTMADVPELGRIPTTLHGWQRGDVLIQGGIIERVGDIGRNASAVIEIDARERVVMPGFVDCHTHACFAGERVNEWDERRRGVEYLEILRRGGGIMSTVRAVRRATRAQLADALLERLRIMLREGTTTVEVKSGYGLTTADELKMLGAIGDAASRWPGTIVATALIGHAIDAEQPDFVRRTIDETLPAVHAAHPSVTIDAYCEKGAWSVDECVELFQKAVALGHPMRVHADQFNSLGMVNHALRLGARSIDHLEASGDEDLAAIGRAATIGVGLPACVLHGLTNGGTLQAAKLGRVLDAGGRVAIASNLNPGSSPTSSMPLIVALATRFCGLEPIEAIRGATRTAAEVLALRDRGVLAEGMRADVCMLRHTDPRMLAHDMGGNPVELVVCNGAIVAGTA